MAGERSFASLGARAADLRIAYQDRLQDADILFAAGRYSMAVALGLYALEILLKFKICERLDLLSLPAALQIHDLDGLLTFAGLSRKLADVQHVKMNWEKIKITARKLNDMRYQPESEMTDNEAEEFFKQLRDSTEGVLPWILGQP